MNALPVQSLLPECLTEFVRAWLPPQEIRYLCTCLSCPGTRWHVLQIRYTIPFGKFFTRSFSITGSMFELRTLHHNRISLKTFKISRSLDMYIRLSTSDTFHHRILSIRYVINGQSVTTLFIFWCIWLIPFQNVINSNRIKRKRKRGYVRMTDAPSTRKPPLWKLLKSNTCIKQGKTRIVHAKFRRKNFHWWQCSLGM